MSPIGSPASAKARRVVGTALSSVALASSVAAAQFDWPQWQGPNRNAQSTETGLLKEWPKDGPPLAWKITGLGGGDSTPSVADGRIYGMIHRGEDEMVRALSEKDGFQMRINLGCPRI